MPDPETLEEFFARMKRKDDFFKNLKKDTQPVEKKEERDDEWSRWTDARTLDQEGE